LHKVVAEALAHAGAGRLHVRQHWVIRLQFDSVELLQHCHEVAGVVEKRLLANRHANEGDALECLATEAPMGLVLHGGFQDFHEGWHHGLIVRLEERLHTMEK
jgi:hypothetical protein